MKKLNRKFLFLISAIGSMIIFVGVVNALNTWSTGYRVNHGGGTKDVIVGAAGGSCHRVTNNHASKDYFVPTKTLAEWNAFASAAPGLSVNIGSCNLGVAIFRTGDSYNGDLGGRLGANAICESAKPANLACNQVYAFMSFNRNSAYVISNMPANYGYDSNAPLYWYSASHGLTKFANNWDDALDIDKNILVSAYTAGLGSKNVWTHSEADGDGRDGDHNCKEATWSSPLQERGTYGHAKLVDGQWLHRDGNLCSRLYPILCIAERSPVNCNDNNQCTDDYYDGSNCHHDPDSSNICTTCSSGTCYCSGGGACIDVPPPPPPLCEAWEIPCSGWGEDWCCPSWQGCGFDWAGSSCGSINF